MRKGLILVAVALASVMSVGCASGYRSLGNPCPSPAQVSGKFAQSYEASQVAPVRLLGAEAEPYDGAPVYVVNGGADVYNTGWGWNRGELGGRRHYIGAQPGHQRGALLGSGFDESGPLRRNAYARRAAADGSSMYNSGDGIVNPYPGNTPTRAPRDFFAPNPPSIGP